METTMNLPNPYRAPDSSLLEQPSYNQPNAKNQILYSPDQIAMASLLGSPVCSAIMMEDNVRQIDPRSSGRRLLVIGIVATIVTITISAFLPLGVLTIIWPLVCAGIIKTLANRSWLEKYTRAINSGAQKRSNWKVALLSIGLFLGIRFLVGIVSFVL